MALHGADHFKFVPLSSISRILDIEFIITYFRLSGPAKNNRIISHPFCSECRKRYWYAYNWNSKTGGI